MAQTVKNLPPLQEIWVRPLGREDPLEKEMQPTLVLLPGESHGGRSLVGYSPWGRKELDTTERLHTHTKDPTSSAASSAEVNTDYTVLIGSSDDCPED